MNKIEKSLLNFLLPITMTLSGASCAKAPEPLNVTESPSCPTTEQAKELFGVDVQRIDTEPCGWVWRGKPESHSAVCPEDYVCSWDVKDDVTVIHHGIGQSAEIFAGTFRRVDNYPAEDKVYNICELYQAEKAFGQAEIPSFEVRFQPVPKVGPQSCPEK